MVATANISADPVRINALALLEEIEWFNKVVQARMKAHFQEDGLLASVYDIAPPPHEESRSVLAEFIEFYKLTFNERLVLMLALVPHVYPEMLDVFQARNPATEKNFTAFGGVRQGTHHGFFPTVGTAVFLLAGNDLARRIKVQQLFEADHIFHRHHIVYPGANAGNEPFLNAQLLINDEYVDFLTGGKLRKPLFSMDFPAKRITTSLDWDDLVLDAYTASQLNEIKIWLEHGQKLMDEWDMKKRLKPGYKALFYGAPGTGKTLTAGLLGKLVNVDVYRVDLSMIISKYIGETEKNLEKVFQKAEHKNWILFFDEADALFGKRTAIADAHDKYANQEIAYLLQRLEDYNGLVILSSNMRGNVDEAFGRRLQAIIHFPVPKAAERYRLWEQAFSQHTRLASEIDLEQIAAKYELAGGSIVNVVQYASLMALHRGDNIISSHDLAEGIRKEFRKEGKTI